MDNVNGKKKKKFVNFVIEKGKKTYLGSIGESKWLNVVYGVDAICL